MRLWEACGFAQALRKVRLQRRDGHTAVFAGIDAVARVRTAHRAVGCGHAQLAGQGQPSGSLRQGHFVARAFASGLERDDSFERGFAGHERTAHVGKQTGGQVHAVDQAHFGLVGQIVARNFGQRPGGADHFDQAERGVLLAQGFPAQAQLGQGRGAE